MCEPILITVITEYLEGLGYIVERVYLSALGGHVPFYFTWDMSLDVALGVTVKNPPAGRHSIFYVRYDQDVLSLASSLRDDYKTGQRLRAYLNVGDPQLCEKIADVARKFIG